MYQTNLRINNYLEEAIWLDIVKVISLIDTNNELLEEGITQQKLSYEQLGELIYNHEEINRIVNDVFKKISVLKAIDINHKQLLGWKDTKDTYLEIRKRFKIREETLILNNNTSKALSIAQGYYNQFEDILNNVISKFNNGIDVWANELGKLYH